MVDARATLTPEQVETLRWVYATPDHPTQKDLAAQYGVHPSQDSRAVRGLSWPDTDGPVFPHRPTHNAQKEQA